MMFDHFMSVELDETDTFKSLGAAATSLVTELRKEERETCDAGDDDGKHGPDDYDLGIGPLRLKVLVLVLVKGVISRRPFGRRVVDNITHVHAPVVDLREF